jgi:hypothetical protein
VAQQNGKPIKDFRAGKIRVSLWCNEFQKDGETRIRHAIRIQKRYRKDDGSYEGTDYYFPEELPELAVAVQRAFEYVVLTESKDTEEVPI